MSEPVFSVFTLEWTLELIGIEELESLVLIILLLDRQTNILFTSVAAQSFSWIARTSFHLYWAVLISLHHIVY